ncbi:sulfite exporter TauE/SafE family protein [Neptunicoccus sediminis]|uniref:sulfite exporter TauE/SafE family protein n=1 Tax=Neptunicoccus sediminis TaxID=1892596 RepID=UPI000845EBF8|nr:sulfite exporter TauE/SafE family protein [Neptunicoccus sediminis]
MPELSTLLPMIVLLMGIGGFAGVLAGLLGVGGGIILVPAFYYAFSGLGYDNAQLMQICLATSLATIVFTSMRSVQSHHKKGAVDWSILRGWAPGIAVGAVIGVMVATGLRSAQLMVIFGCLGIVIGLYLAFGKVHWRLGEQMPRGIVQSLLSAIMGFMSVLMGIGGGSFGVPTMTLFGVPIHRAVATAAGFGLVIAVPSVIGFLLGHPDPVNLPPYTVGYVNIPAFLLIICMTLLTAPLGVKVAHAMDPKPLKRVFAFFLLLVALNMLRKVYFG